jgi:hypothetical protein
MLGIFFVQADCILSASIALLFLCCFSSSSFNKKGSITSDYQWGILVFSSGTYLVETTTFVKTSANHGQKKTSKFKKNTHVDGMMIHNAARYLVQTQTSFVRYKTSKFITIIRKAF